MDFRDTLFSAAFLLARLGMCALAVLFVMNSQTAQISPMCAALVLGLHAMVRCAFRGMRGR